MEYDPHLEARVASLETAMEFVVGAIKEVKSEVKDLRADIKNLRAEMKDLSDKLQAQMRTDFRIVFGAIITLGIGEAGLLAKAFGWI